MLFFWTPHQFLQWHAPTTPSGLANLSQRKPKPVAIRSKEHWQARLWQIRERISQEVLPISNATVRPELRPVYIPAVPQQVRQTQVPVRLPRFQSQQRNGKRAQQTRSELIVNDHESTKEHLETEQFASGGANLLRMDRFALEVQCDETLKSKANTIRECLATLVTHSLCFQKLNLRGIGEQLKSLAGVNMSGANYHRWQKLMQEFKSQGTPSHGQRRVMKPLVFTFAMQQTTLPAKARRVNLQHVVCVAECEQQNSDRNQVLFTKTQALSKVWLLYKRTANSFVQFANVDNAALQLQTVLTTHGAVLVSMNNDDGNCVGVLAEEAKFNILEKLQTAVVDLRTRDDIVNIPLTQLQQGAIEIKVFFFFWFSGSFESLCHSFCLGFLLAAAFLWLCLFVYLSIDFFLFFLLL